MKYQNSNHIKLKELPDHEINKFYYSCINLNMNIHFNGGLHNQFKDIFKLLVSLKKGSETESKMILYHMALAHKNRLKGFIVCLNKQVYSQSKCSYAKTTGLLEALVEHGYGSLYRGDSEREGVVRYKSVFVMSDKLINLFETKKLEIYPSNTPQNNKSVVVNNKTRGIRQVTGNVNTINKFLKGFDFRFQEDKLVPELTRIYGDTLQDYGRFYFSAQTLKSKYRSSIKINGNPVTELDYSSNHARICAEIKGVALSEDFKPYHIQTPSLVTKVPENGFRRDVFKLGMMCLLNCKGNHSRALSNAWKEELPDHGGIDNCKEIIDQLKINNIEYLDEIKKQNAASLQYLDSCIMEKIMLKLLEQNIPFLPYHDSIVVPEDRQDITSTIMKDSWREVLGTDHCCVIDIKY